jgi:putative peptidoglycan lipid II flippase
MNLFKSSIVVSILSLLISVVSFVNQIVIASFFGAGNEMDIYLLASSIPLMFAGILTSALSYSLIPHFIKKELQYKQSFKEYIGAFLLKNAKYIILLGITFAVFFYIVIPVIYPTLSNEDVKIVRIINVISWMIFVITIFFSFLACSLNAKKKFIIPLLLNIFPFVFSIIFTFLLYDFLGIISISLGVLSGSLVTLGIGFIYMKSEIIFFENAPQYNFEINQYLKYLKYPVFAMLTFSVYQSIDSFWAPRLGESALSYLGYSQRILVTLGTLVIIGPSTVLIPRLTIAIEEGRTDDYYRDASMILKMILALSSTIVVVGIILSKPIVEIMFERGEFNTVATNGVSEVLSYMLVGLIFMLCVVVLFRILFIKKLGFKIALIGVFSALSYFVLSGFLSSLFDLTGIALAYIFTWAMVLIVTIKLLFKESKDYFYNSHLFFFLVKQLASLITIYFFGLYLYDLFGIYLESKQLYLTLFFTFIIAILSLGVYSILAIFIFKIDEIIILFEKLIKKINK